MKLKGKFCDKPFTWLEMGREEQGEVHCHTCCSAWLPKIVGDLASEDIDQIWNGEVYRNIRRSIHDGSFRFCNHDLCPLINEDRLPNLEDVKDPYLKNIIDHKLEVLDKGPRTINMANDLSCNLSCPSCRTGEIMLSSGPEYERMVNMHEDLLEKTLHDIELLILCSGGDPLASKYYRQLLTSLDGRRFPDLKIQIVTNGVLLTDELWSQMEKIHSNLSILCISVDAFKEDTYKVVRRGGNFSKLVKNLEFVSKVKKTMPQLEVRLDFVVQNHNYREMADFSRWGLELGVDAVSFQRIINWGTFSEDQFNDHAVYLRGHKNYRHFLRCLKDPIFDHPKVFLGNLSEFKS